MLVTVALAFGVAKEFRRATESVLAAAHVQWALRARLGGVLATFGGSIALIDTTISTVGWTVSWVDD